MNYQQAATKIITLNLHLFTDMGIEDSMRWLEGVNVALCTIYTPDALEDDAKLQRYYEWLLEQVDNAIVASQKEA